MTILSFVKHFNEESKVQSTLCRSAYGNEGLLSVWVEPLDPTTAIFKLINQPFTYHMGYHPHEDHKTAF